MRSTYFFMDPRLEAPAKLFVGFLVVIVLLSNFNKLFDALLLKVLLGHKEDLVLLQTVSFPRDVQRKVLRIHDAFDKFQPLWKEFVTINHGEKNATDIQLDVVALVLGVKQVERRTAWHEKQRAELKLAFHDAGMLH